MLSFGHVALNLFGAIHTDCAVRFTVRLYQTDALAGYLRAVFAVVFVIASSGIYEAVWMMERECSENVLVML